MKAEGRKGVLLGISGGIAAYKSCELVSRLRKAGVQVHVVMTKNACEFVTPLTFQSLSENQVAVDTFENPQYWEVEHIALAKKTDLVVLAPATANLIAKLAHGLADDMLTTTVLASPSPVLIAPAMNTQMYQAEATQRNIQALKERGVRFIGPGGGFLACGDVGPGRMSEPAEIFEEVMRLLEGRQDYAGVRAVVTAGPTREMLDPVRYLSNRSSGKMGYAIAGALLELGAKVRLITGPVSLEPPMGAEVAPVVSTQDLYDEVMSAAREADVLIQAAAPADYRAEDISPTKLKKQQGQPLSLTLAQTQDVAAAAGREKRPGQLFVGFAAETDNHLQNARDKLKRKNLDMICLNDVTQPGAGFEVDTNQLTLVTRTSVSKLPMLTKQQAAHRLLDAIARLREASV